MRILIKLSGILVIVVFICVISTGHTTAQSVKVLRVVGNHAPPYRIIQGHEFSGICFDVMKAIGKRIGVTVAFFEQPFKRALYSMEQGSADIMVGPNKTTEREVYMVYTKATVGRASKAFYVHPDSTPIQRYEDLKGKLVVVHRGKLYFNKFDMDTSLKKVVVDSYAQAINMVSKKRADVVIIPELEGDYLLKEHAMDLKKSSLIIEGNQSYIAISKKSPAIGLQKKIEDAMDQIKADGTMDEILSRYRFNS
jgi:polar amino acid transport system substrate-binding protein